jgi:hypothetical protein
MEGIWLLEGNKLVFASDLFIMHTGSVSSCVTCALLFALPRRKINGQAVIAIVNLRPMHSTVRCAVVKYQLTEYGPRKCVYMSLRIADNSGELLE